MKLLIILFALAVAQIASAQVKPVPLDKKALPKTIHYDGHIVNAVKYTDNEGDHVVITTETGEVEVKEDGESFTKADVYAYNYVMNGGKPTLAWQMHDFTIICPVDTKAKYVPGTFAVTDLNKDGKAEIWLMYRIACRGDVSPASMKIIMHEGNKKYAVRGTSKIKISDKDYSGGEYTMDEALKTGPPVFKQYALLLWEKNLLETGDY